MTEPTMPEGFPALLTTCPDCENGYVAYEGPNAYGRWCEAIYCQKCNPPGFISNANTVITFLANKIAALEECAESTSEKVDENTKCIDELCDPQEGPHADIRRLDGDIHEKYDELTNRIADQDERIAALEEALILAGIPLAERIDDADKVNT